MAWLMGFPASRSSMLPLSHRCCSASRAVGRLRGSLRGYKTKVISQGLVVAEQSSIADLAHDHLPMWTPAM